MKLNIISLSFLALSLFFAFDADAGDISISQIKKRGMVYCGTAADNELLAYKDENGVWQGFNASLCRAFAAAFLDKKDNIKMIPTKTENIASSLKSGKIDVMFGEFPLPAETEISSSVISMAPIFRDKIMLLAHKKEGATSLEDYKGSTVCLVRNSADAYHLQAFVYHYDLQLKPIYFSGRDLATNAFYLNRCILFPATSGKLKTIIKNKFKNKDTVELLPETIGLHQIYFMVDKNSLELGIAGKWIINALRAAAFYDIKSSNLPMILGNDDVSVQNLIGNTPALWEKFKIYPNWMRQFIPDEGNFSEMYERHLGPDTEVDLDNEEDEHGLAAPLPFI